MIDPGEPLAVQVARQTRIIEALIRRAQREDDVGGSAYGLFQSAIALQGAVWEKTRDLERALDDLGRAASELELARSAREQTQRALADALTAMEGGVALFSDGALRVCNDLFRRLLPDIADRIEPGLALPDYLPLVETSREIDAGDAASLRGLRAAAAEPDAAATFVIGLRRDRWFQITRQATSAGNVVLMQTEITDIVRQNRLREDDLIDRQAHYLQAAFDEMSNGVCSLSRGGRVQIHNARFVDLLGLPYTLVRKGTSLRRIVEHLPEGEGAGWLEELRATGLVQRRIRRGDGRVIDVRVHRMPDRGFLINATDATLETHATELLEERVRDRTTELTEANRRLREQHEHQTRVEEALRLAKDEAEAANRARTRFLAAASHDLLQPVNAAKLLISTLNEALRGGPHTEAAERLHGSFASIEQLLGALLDISRLETAEADLVAVPIRLDSLLGTLQRDLAPMAEAKGLRFDVVSSTLWVRSDRRYLFRSLQNLVVNAIQYTDRGRVLLGCRRRGGTVCIEVWDTGIGIPLKDQQRIFEEFARAESAQPRQGLGLGLSIVERACRSLGHTVRVRSKPGVGSIFTLELALVESGLVRETERDGDRSEQGPGLELIVLVVEDNADERFALTQRLEAWGASVLAAASVEEALQLTGEIGIAPDIILADFQLGDGRTGAEAIDAIRTRTGVHVPAIVITAEHGPRLGALGREHDFSVMTKPVQLARLRPLMQWKAAAAAAAFSA